MEQRNSFELDARNVLEGLRRTTNDHEPRQPFTTETMKDFAKLREAQLSLFASHMRLETRFPDIEPSDQDLDKRIFCEHFPSAFKDAEDHVDQITEALGDVKGLMTSLNERLQGQQLSHVDNDVSAFPPSPLRGRPGQPHRPAMAQMGSANPSSSQPMNNAGPSNSTSQRNASGQQQSGRDWQPIVGTGTVSAVLAHNGAPASSMALASPGATDSRRSRPVPQLPLSKGGEPLPGTQGAHPQSHYAKSPAATATGMMPLLSLAAAPSAFGQQGRIEQGPGGYLAQGQRLGNTAATASGALAASAGVGPITATATARTLRPGGGVFSNTGVGGSQAGLAGTRSPPATQFQLRQ